MQAMLHGRGSGKFGTHFRMKKILLILTVGRRKLNPPPTINLVQPDSRIAGASFEFAFFESNSARTQ